MTDGAPNQWVEANRRHASALELDLTFDTVASARQFLSATVAHPGRSAALYASSIRTMKTIQLLTTGAVALLYLVGCQSSRVERATQPPLTIRVVGPAGASFTGTVKADGVPQQVSGTVPRELEFASRRLACSFQQGTEPGALRFEVNEDAKLLGSAATTGPRGHCRFSVHDGSMGSRSSWRFARD